MYSEQEKEKVLRVYKSIGKARQTIKILDYPSRNILKKWLMEVDISSIKPLSQWQIKNLLKRSIGRKHHKSFNDEDKINAIKRVSVYGEMPTVVARSIGAFLVI